MGPGAGLGRGAGDRGEVHVGRQIRRARVVEDLVGGVAAQRLQGGAGARARVAVVDDERGAALGRKPAADLGGEHDRRRRDLGDRAGRRVAQLGGQQCGGLRTRRRQAEDQRRAIATEGDQAFAPAFGALFELADRQGVEELVGDQQQRALGHLVQALVPTRREVAGAGRQALSLSRAKLRAELYQMQIERAVEPGHQAGGAQGVDHQRAATRPQLDQAQRLRAAHALPGVGAPEADQLAEHLGNLRRGDEVAAGAEGVAGHVIAVFRVRERLGHVVGHGDRPEACDPGDEPLAKRGQGTNLASPRGFRRACAAPRSRGRGRSAAWAVKGPGPWWPRRG